MSASPPTILLVEPNQTGNVGAVARVMANFGLPELRIVGAPDLPADRDYMAARVEGRPILEMLRTAPRADTLAGALAETRVAIAVTRRTGKHRTGDMGPHDLVPFLAALPPDTAVALVFGREADGLTTEEIDLCGRRLTIPTVPEARSLNLAQAVGVVAWTWFAGTQAREAGARVGRPAGAASPRDDAQPETSPPSADATRTVGRRLKALAFKEISEQPATVAEVEAFLLELHPGLERIGFFEGDRGPDAFRSLRRIFSRAALTEREVRLLRGLARKLR